MQVKQVMLAELSAPVIQVLANQHAQKLLDYHLGNYILEEGEVIEEEFDLTAMQSIATRIVLCDNTQKQPIVVTYDEVYIEDAV